VVTDLHRWLLLFHQLPQKPAYLRVKIWRKLASLGAVMVKGGIYVLPETSDTLEDFQWVLKEIEAGGGEGSIVSANFVDGLTDVEIIALFTAARESDFTELAEQVRAVTEDDADSRRVAAVRLRKRLSDVIAIDFFPSAGRQGVEELISALEEPPESPSIAPLDARRYRRRTWVTREHLFVDRIASAWLIANVIDPHARFRFITPGEALRSAEIGFDFPEAEFTHIGDRCTFEVLRERFALDAPGLGQIAEIIHDLDCKDGKYARPEATGFLAALSGMTLIERSDERRIERGGQLLADLQAYFASRSTRARRTPRTARTGATVS
jgi:hypothetical protein